MQWHRIGTEPTQALGLARENCGFQNFQMEKTVTQNSLARVIFSIILTMSGITFPRTTLAQDSSQLPDLSHLDETMIYKTLRLLVRPAQKQQLDSILAKRNLNELTDEEKKIIEDLVNEGVRLMVNSHQPIY